LEEKRALSLGVWQGNKGLINSVASKTGRLFQVQSKKKVIKARYNATALKSQIRSLLPGTNDVVQRGFKKRHRTPCFRPQRNVKQRVEKRWRKTGGHRQMPLREGGGGGRAGRGNRGSRAERKKNRRTFLLATLHEPVGGPGERKFASKENLGGKDSTRPFKELWRENPESEDRKDRRKRDYKNRYGGRKGSMKKRNVLKMTRPQEGTYKKSSKNHRTIGSTGAAHYQKQEKKGNAGLRPPVSRQKGGHQGRDLEVHEQRVEKGTLTCKPTKQR